MKKRFFSTLIVVSMLMSLLPAYVVQAEHCPGNYDVLFSTYNYSVANNGPTEDVIVTFDEAKMVKEITTYHWNHGYGKAPGSISIYKDGTLDGTWTATARGGSGATNVNWDVFPDYVMEPGHTYQIVDSDIASWSCNEQSGYRGFVEICGYAAEGGTTPDPIEDAKAKALEESGLYAINITDAGAAQIDTWASTGHGKDSVMFPVMSLMPMDWEEPLGYFFRATGEPTLHKLTVYGSKHIDESDITLAGVRSSGVFQETVYGEGEEALYAYTVPFMAHTEDFTISVKVDGQTVLDIPCTHIPPEAPHPYVTNLYPEDYTENKDGYLESFTVKIGGFSLPADKSSYKFQRNIDTEPYYNTDFAECSAISAKDEYGEFTLTFTLKENLGIYDLQWLDLLINDSTAWFLSKADHLTANYNGVYNYNGQEQGSNARIASPYAAANRAESTVKSPKFSVPEEADETPVNIGITPNDYEGGKICYSTDGGSTWSKWANIGSSISVPLSNGNGDYNIIFKYKKDGLEEKQSNTYTVTLAVPDKEPEVVPTVTFPTVTTNQTIQAAITAGSYTGGKYAYTTDGWKTSTDYMPVSSKVNVTLPDEYGVYSVAFVFVKEGYISYKTEEIAVDYNDGMAAAPTSGGIIDVSNGKEVSKKGDSYVISGDKDSVYRIYANAPEGQALEAIFKASDGAEAVTKTLSFNSGRKQYETEITREDMKNGASVDLRVKATGGSLAGHELTLKLKFVEKAFIKALYAPTVHYDVKKDNNGTYYALKPGAVISGAFESAAGEDRTHGMTLTYLTASGESKTVTANAEGDKNGQYYASVTLPEDTASLKQISYELLSEGKVESSVEYNVENYRVEANTNVTGIGDNYIGTTFTIKGTDTDKIIILTEKNYSSIPLGDIKTGEYTYEISGASGHIFGGTVSVTRDSDITLSDLPALGSVTAQTTGFVSTNSGKEINPKANVVLNLTTPDGKEIKVHSAAGEKMEQIPIGAEGTAKASFDGTVSDEICALTPASADVSVKGDENIAFTYTPFTYRTITGTLFGRPLDNNGIAHYCAPNGNIRNGNTITLTQEITRGGATETVTMTASVDNQNKRWSFKCYDNIPAKIEFKAFTWDTKDITVTDNGNVNVGDIEMTSGQEETLIKLNAKLATPGAYGIDGKRYPGGASSEVFDINSSFIGVSRISVRGYSSKTYYPGDGVYEVITQNGQAYLKIKKDVFIGQSTIDITAVGTTEYGGLNFSLYDSSGYRGQDQRVTTDKDGVPSATFTATYPNGELRATVVDDSESGMTGFLVLLLGKDRSYCYFDKGVGELRIPYAADRYRSYTVVSFMVPDEDAADAAEMLRTNAAILYNWLPGDSYDSKLYYRWNYENKLKYKYDVWLSPNVYLYLDGMQPTEAYTNALLPPYRFAYHFEMGDTLDTVKLIGVIENRYNDSYGVPIKSIELFTPDYNDPSNTYVRTGEMTAKPDYTVNGWKYTAEDPYRALYSPPSKMTFTADIPLNYSGVAAFRIKLKHEMRNYQDEQEFYASELVPIFSIANPGDLYIADQLKAQGLDKASEEAQKTWKINIPVRAYATNNSADNVITLYDNGTEIKKYTVQGRNTGNTSGVSQVVSGEYYRLPVVLTDNLNSGMHVMWATRTMDGEKISTEPIMFMVSEGTEHNEVYVSKLEWTHWNARIPGSPDRMYFENLSDLAGKEIWVWPGKRHQMRFRVNNATSEVLEGVSIKYRTMVNRGIFIQDENGNILQNTDNWMSAEYSVPCKLLFESRKGNYSEWGFDDYDFGYLQGFEFEFHYNAALEKDLHSMTMEQLDEMETEQFYHVYGLGELPDAEKEALAIANMSGAERTKVFDSMETPKALQDLDLRVTENTDKSFKMELKKPTDLISEYTVTAKESGQISQPDIQFLMESERENGNQNPDEAGWDVCWTEFNTKQGKLFIRFASFEGEDNSGRAALLTHSTYYVSKSVSDALMSGTAPKSGGINLFGVLDGGGYSEEPTHWTKTAYDISSFVYGAADIGHNTLQDALWLDYKISGLKESSDTYKAYKGVEEWGKTNKFAKGANTTFKVLGVVDFAVTYANGPAGNDPKELRKLLGLIRDEKTRKSLEWQINDYEQMRESIYKQDCTISGISSAANFAPMGLFGKVGVFIGGIANTILSGIAKADNGQVYNSTLHDIKMALEFQARRDENFRKSLGDAEQWLRDKMDSIYGKGHWSEYALAQERKNWVLKEFPGGIVKYVWKDKAPEFDVVLDPAGFVFEAVEDNRVDGVTATLYYSDKEDGSYSVWAAPSENGQQNPILTDESGSYMWMVPNGWWKVLYEKEGYLPSLTNPMAVPPIHTAVNIGLLSTIAPKAAVSADDGKMTVLFSKYMQLESLIRLFEDETYAGNEFDASAFTVQFYDKNGVAIPGKVTFPDKIANTGYLGSAYSREVIDSDWFVRTAIFTPTDKTVDLSGATWVFADGIKSYSGVELDKNGSPENLYLISLNAGEGTLSIPSLITSSNGSLSKLPSPVREGYTFDGWYTSETGGTKVTTDTVFDANTAIYAHWTKESTDSGNSGRTHGGGGASLVKYEVTVANTENGSVSLSPANAAKGSTVTITVSPDEGYRLAGLTVTDQNGKEIAITEKDGKYTFIMPTGKAMVTPVFEKADGAVKNPFVDVKNSDYFYDAVLWAVKENITSGTSDTTFSPNDSCTRAQTVTFLWRAAGSPEPKTKKNPFADVKADDYFYKAVLWAYENGITKGTSDDKFSPSDTVSRGQTVTFLYRLKGEKTNAVNPFTDVKTGDYYYNSVLWAYENGITSGTSDTTFSPNDNCLRGQIVTFLYRFNN